jgi:LysR family glycine cleavage system transcriptional activator
MRAFEAAARSLSFKRAADELAITPSAVGHQVKALEDFLGVQLFLRRSNGLILTHIGQVYLSGLRKAFDQLAAATSEVLEESTQGPLTINLYSSLAQLWLMPRLGSLRRAHPQLEVCLISSVETFEFSSDEIDLVIRYGRGDWPNVRCDYLLAEEIFPVCSPAYLARSGPLKHPSDLAHHPLIQYYAQPDEWHEWLSIAKAEGVDPSHGLRLDSRALTQQAALDGLGVAIARRPFVNDDLAAGRLAAPFDVKLQSDCAYYLVCPQIRAKRPNIVAFREWILAECHAAPASQCGQG